MRDGGNNLGIDFSLIRPIFVSSKLNTPINLQPLTPN